MSLVAIETKDAQHIYNFLLDQKAKDVLPMLDALNNAKQVNWTAPKAAPTATTTTTAVDTTAKTTADTATTAATTVAKTKN